jgi:hypothetical protein
MKSIVNGSFSKFSSVAAIGLLAVGMATKPAAGAGKHSTKPAGQAVQVLARVDLSGSLATRIVSVEKDGKQYLYIRSGSSAEVTVVDVTNPNKPRILEGTTASVPAVAGEMFHVGDTRAMIVTSQQSPSATPETGVDAQAVTILDVDDPANPTVARTFPGVTSLLTDDGRGLIYIANAQGLWIIQAKDKTPTAASLAEEQND